ITQRNIHKGLRWNTSRAYIHENKDISRLHVCDKSQVTRIEFDKKKAVRIHFHWHGMPQVIEIKREIILSAGALHTPHILMLSGIGDKAHLKEHGIECVADLPGVGQGLKDHVA
ncbi:GMC family oxidoreductase N-terminal domain-containing protein, partial [Acinetobacter baumannii]